MATLCFEMLEAKVACFECHGGCNQASFAFRFEWVLYRQWHKTGLLLRATEFDLPGPCSISHWARLSQRSLWKASFLRVPLSNPALQCKGTFLLTKRQAGP